MVYCTECGTKAVDDAKYCYVCGSAITDAAAEKEAPERVYTVKTALEEFFRGAISESKLRDLIRQKKIPHIRLGARVLLRDKALRDWLVTQEQISTAAIYPMRRERVYAE